MTAAEAAVSDFLRAAPVLPLPEGVAARLREALADEIEARRAVGVDPDPQVDRPLKLETPLWVETPELLDDDFDI